MPETNKRRKKSGKTAKPDSSDRRVRRTQRFLKAAMIQLIAEKGYDEVSVQEIIERADVGRTSFYTYFRSKEDLLLCSMDDMGELFDAGAAELSPESACDFVPMFFQHLEENRKLAKALLGSSLSVHVVREHVQGQIFRHFRKAFGARPGDPVPISVEGAAVFASGALIAMMHWWVGLDRPVSRAKVGELFRTILEPGLSAVARTQRRG